MASWFTRSRQPAQQLGPPWAVPEAQLFDDDEDPAARLLRRRVRWEVVDEARNARLAGQEAFLSLAVLRLSTSDGGVGARIPLTAIHREEYMQPIFGANYLTGLAMQDGATVRWTLEFLSAGAAQFGVDPAVMWPLLAVKASYLEASMHAIEQDYGGIDAYLGDVLKVDAERLRQAYLVRG